MGDVCGCALYYADEMRSNKVVGEEQYCRDNRKRSVIDKFN